MKIMHRVHRLCPRLIRKPCHPSSLRERSQKIIGDMMHAEHVDTDPRRKQPTFLPTFPFPIKTCSPCCPSPLYVVPSPRIPPIPSTIVSADVHTVPVIIPKSIHVYRRRPSAALSSQT
jgi:hypothetical protein